MSEENKLEELRKCFKYPIREVFVTNIVLRTEALTNPRRSIMEQINLFDYTIDDVYRGVDILKDLLNEVSKDSEARMVLGCTCEMNDDEANKLIEEIGDDIEKLFNKLKNNEKDIAATSDDKERRKDYDKLMKGFRVIADVLKEGNFSPDVVAATLITIRDSSNHCLGNWKHILIGLMIQFEYQIECMIGNEHGLLNKRGVINYEEDRIYSTLVEAFYAARKYIAEYIVSDFIAEYIWNCGLEDAIYENENVAHYKGVCMDYLNNNYHLNIPQIDVEDDFLSEDMKNFVISNFKEYLLYEDLGNLIYDRATKIVMDDIAKNPDKISQLIDWFDKYLDEKKLYAIKEDRGLVVDFFCRYITKGEYNQEIRYLAIREIMLYYGFIEVEHLKDKMIFREDRIRLVLSDLGEEDQKEKRQIITILRKDPEMFISVANDPVFSYDDIWESEEIRNIIRGFLGVEEALLYACEHRSVDIAKYLIYNGALLEVEDESGQTPLFIAYKQGLDEVVECLLKKGANIDTMDFYSNTLLMLACERNDDDMVKYLVEKGVDINISNTDEGNTALMIACIKDNTSIANYLVENGADVNVENKYRETALEFACENHNRELMLNLVKNFASITNLKQIENTIRLLIGDVVKELEYVIVVHIQALIALDNEDWLIDMFGNTCGNDHWVLQKKKAVRLSEFLDNYLKNSQLSANKLKNCVNFMWRERSRLINIQGSNGYVIRVLGEYIIKINQRLMEKKCNINIPREEMQNNRGREEGERSFC